jgi:hypothetical protein
VPESSPVALLRIDVINDMDFEGAEALVRQAVPMAQLHGDDDDDDDDER